MMQENKDSKAVRMEERMEGGRRIVRKIGADAHGSR